MNRHMLNLYKFAGCVAIGMVLYSLAGHTLVQAQNPAGPPAGAGMPDNNNPKLEDRRRQMSESGLRRAELDATTAEADYQKHILSAIEHIREDFTRIQVVRNNIARNLVARKPLDYKLISQQAGEINKRANRLNLYMLARASEGKEENDAVELANEEMSGALVKLCKLIDSFTENPALKNATTIEVKDVGKAKEEKANADRDLLAIIKLSQSIQKKSDGLKAPK